MGRLGHLAPSACASVRVRYRAALLRACAIIALTTGSASVAAPPRLGPELAREPRLPVGQASAAMRLDLRHGPATALLAAGGKIGEASERAEK